MTRPRDASAPRPPPPVEHLSLEGSPSLNEAVVKLLDTFAHAQALYPPRGMSRIQSAAYIGVSPSLFDEMVKDGRMPGPKRINSRVVWDRVALDAAFAALPDRDEAASDDEWKVAL